MRKCPTCGESASHVIYYGLPMWLCDCTALFGFWSDVTFGIGLPFNGVFMVFEGAYLPALWHWLKGCEE